MTPWTDGILQGNILEWVAVPFSRGLPNPGIEPRCPTLQADSLPAELPGKPMEYYTATERNEIRSLVDVWMNLGSVIQSEVSQKEKNKYCILTHIYGILKDGTDEPICRAAMETDIENRRVDTKREGEGGKN